MAGNFLCLGLSAANPRFSALCAATAKLGVRINAVLRAIPIRYSSPTANGQRRCRVNSMNCQQSSCNCAKRPSAIAVNSSVGWRLILEWPYAAYPKAKVLSKAVIGVGKAVMASAAKLSAKHSQSHRRRDLMLGVLNRQFGNSADKRGKVFILRPITAHEPSPQLIVFAVQQV
jgi:hypothetical protein